MTGRGAIAVAIAALAAGCAHAPPPAPEAPAPPPDAPAPAPWTWPVEGPVSSPFGDRVDRRRAHTGIDIRCPDGTEVRAAAAGRVRHAGRRWRGYGKLIVLEHEDGTTTWYAHNSELLVSIGEAVPQGARIARSGHTGRVTAPHLHFEVRTGDIPRDPALYLPAREPFTTSDTAHGGARWTNESEGSWNGSGTSPTSPRPGSSSATSPRSSATGRPSAP